MWIVWLPLVALVAMGCRDEFERLPPANEAEAQAITELYKRFMEDAKKTKPEDSMNLLRHFSSATLTGVSVADFKAKASKFIGEVAAGKFEPVEFRGARAPSRVRLLLITTPQGKGVVPFVQAAGGWKIDDVDMAFGDTTKKVNDKGAVPAFPPQVTASLAVLQDPLATLKEKFKESLRLADAAHKELLTGLVQQEQPPAVKAGLLYAQWKATGGACEPFAKAFPIDQAVQKELLDGDVDSYRIMLAGLIECAAVSKDLAPMLALYRGCHAADEATRSEYVEPVVQLASAKPEMVLKASLAANIKYEEDPVANIVVGALHGEAENPMVKFLNQHSKTSGKTGALAKAWLAKMAERDQLEPPADGAQPTE